jgi:hypothetical protein
LVGQTIATTGFGNGHNMVSRHTPFPIPSQRRALARQKSRCASCGFRVTAIGEAGRADHAFGERAEAHHVIPHKMGGPITVENCVVLCQACHLNAHQGGRWADASIYDDLSELPMEQKIAEIAALYPHYDG